MIIIIACSLLGVFCAIAFDLYIPQVLSIYAAIVILSAIDSVMGACKALLSDRFDAITFLSGFFGNAILAALFMFFGKKIDLDLYMPIVFVFSLRIFSNFGYLRRVYLKKVKKKVKKMLKKF